MKILITGANGYVGSSLNKALKNKYNVTTLTRKTVDLTKSLDVNNFFKDKYFDVIIHCAVVGGSRLKEDTWNDLDANLAMYFNLLQCRSSFNKFLHFGSGAELYTNSKPYGLSKHIIRKSIYQKDNFYNIRIFGVFNEDELDTRFIKANILRYINKQPLIIHQNILMDFIFMPDLIKIVEHYINNDGPTEIEGTYKKTYSLFEIANIINKLNSYRVEIKTLSTYTGKNYCGQLPVLPIKFIGIEKGIQEVYNILNTKLSI